MDAQVLAFSIIILLFSVIVHEVMHGVVALYFGDHTARDAGRLTLNPIPHIDPFGTILLPAILLLSGSPILFGYAKPVPINPLNFRDIKMGEIWVSAAGILSNLGLAILASILYHILGGNSTQTLINSLLIFTVYINLILAIFNLIPVPPLDGSKVVMALLPYNAARAYQSLERFGFLILIMLMLIPFGNSTIISTVLSFGVNLLLNLLGIPPL